MKLGKKGLSHIEVILSFVIFLGFLVFLIAILNPFKITNKDKTYLDVLERGIKDYTSQELKFQALILNKTREDCFYIEDYEDRNIIAKDSVLKIVYAYSTSDLKVYVNGIDNFYYLYSSSEFEENRFDGKNCGKIEKNGYDFGLKLDYNVTSYNKLKDLVKNSSDNYRDTGISLGLPSFEEYSFNVRDSQGNWMLNFTKGKPNKVEILARDVPIQIVYSNGTITYAILNIQVW